MPVGCATHAMKTQTCCLVSRADVGVLVPETPPCASFSLSEMCVCSLSTISLPKVGDPCSEGC